MTIATRTGGCLCSGVRYEISGPLRPVIGCHCRQCRKTSGHHVAATAAPRAALRLVAADTLRWFESSPDARRGFCGRCGGNLFWEQKGADATSIFTGTLDDASGLSIAGHIFVADKGEYYEITDGTPCFAGDWIDEDAL